MYLRRSVGFLLTRRFSPRATPRMAPARSLHYLRDFPMVDGIGRATGVAAAALTGAAALALQYFRKDRADDDEAPRKKEEKEEDMKARFEDWAKKYKRTYRDEEEKAMRFQVFKDRIKWIESLPPSVKNTFLPENCFTDCKEEEILLSPSCLVDDGQEYLMKFLADIGKGDAFVVTPAVMDGLKKSTQVSA